MTTDLAMDLPPNAVPDLELGRRFIAASPVPGDVLQCGVTGSHDYGFSSPDSDLDLKGLFIAPTRRLLGMHRPPEAFDRLVDFEGVECDLTLNEVMPGLFSFESDAFFPVDDQGWGNQGNPHNFHFTTEIHTTFNYQGGEVFTFIGDDDLWLFINGELAIDLGGVHPELTGTVDLDAAAAAIGITVGGTYAMDIFHAERHTVDSHFRIDTSIQCFIIPG